MIILCFGGGFKRFHFCMVFNSISSIDFDVRWEFTPLDFKLGGTSIKQNNPRKRSSKTFIRAMRLSNRAASYQSLW